MEQLTELIERCVSAAVVAEPEDLPALGQLHTCLLEVATAASSAPFSDNATRVAGLVEKLVLRETADATAMFERICNEVRSLQSLAGGGEAIAVESASPPPPVVPAAAPRGDDLTEQPIAEADRVLVFDFVSEASTHLTSAEGYLLRMEDEPDNLELVNAIFRAFHTIKGVAGFLNLRQIGRLSHAAETLLDLARNGKLRLLGGRLDAIFAALDLAKRMVAAVESATRSGEAPPAEPALAPVVQQLEAAANLDTDGGPTASAALAAVSTPARSAAPTTAESSVKVCTDRLDSLINTVGELVIAQAMVSQDLAGAALAANQRLARNLSQVGKITRSLQDLSMSMRMIPVQGVFQKMARLVRDVARKAGKDVQFVQSGGETELDRNVVEAIGDPLVHMVRNSVDHGIEPADVRTRAGKPAAGRVSLRAFHQAGNVVIEIADDGKGLDTARILKKAVAAGIVREGQELSDQETFRLIFHPGLSTADKVTDISGRGVGMDVVRKNVEALRGRIEIASTPGQGSVFTLRLPLTLAVIDGLVVKVGAERYIVPITSIEQSIRPTPEQVSTVNGRGEMCMVRDRLLPLVRLHRLFGVPSAAQDPTRALVVIVQDGANRCSLLVDELLGQQQVVIKSLGPTMRSIPGISGCAILGDGNVSLILDVAGIITTAFNQKGTTA